MNVLIACGGTGGHLFPGIAVAEALESRGHQVLLLISEKKVDAQASEKYGILQFKTVPAIAKPPTLSPKMIPFLFRLWKSVRQCKAILKDQQCDVVLGMGGFTSLPPIIAGKGLGLATYVHDSNALPGKANRLTARWCQKVLIGLDAAKTYFNSKKVVLTGTPIRKELMMPLREDRAKAKFNLPSDGKAILVMGGSQGAKQLNSLVVEAAKFIPEIAAQKHSQAEQEAILERKTQAISAARPMSQAVPLAQPSSTTKIVNEPKTSSFEQHRKKTRTIAAAKANAKVRFLHITGTGDYERVKNLAKDIEGYEVLAFCDDMASAYAACDFAICRAGASSLTELSYLGMPSILVPYPYAADDHQTLNAEVFEQAGAALIRQEADMTVESLVEDITRITQSQEISREMAQQADALAVKDAAQQICDVLEETIPSR